VCVRVCVPVQSSLSQSDSPPPVCPSIRPSGCVPQEKEMEKQKLLYQQARLHDRGAAEMVLQTISASKGGLLPSSSRYQCVDGLVTPVDDLSLWGSSRRDGSHGGLHPEAGHSRPQRRELHRPAGTSASPRVPASSSGLLLTLQRSLFSLTENVGLPEGEEGRGLLPESGWPDAVMQVTL